jgi:uncharacterized membrane protein
MLLAFLIGFFAGLRAMVAAAGTSWAAYLGWLKLERPLSLIGSLPATIVLTLLAAVEIVADKLPRTPKRTSTAGLSARILVGGLSGACVAASSGLSVTVGSLLGIAGAIVGTFVGYQARVRLVQALGVRDIYVAAAEDIIAIGGTLWILSQ